MLNKIEQARTDSWSPSQTWNGNLGSRSTFSGNQPDTDGAHTSNLPKRLTREQKIGVTVAPIVLLIIIIFGALYISRRRERQPRPNSDDENEAQKTHNVSRGIIGRILGFLTPIKHQTVSHVNNEATMVDVNRNLQQNDSLSSVVIYELSGDDEWHTENHQSGVQATTVSPGQLRQRDSQSSWTSCRCGHDISIRALTRTPSINVSIRALRGVSSALSCTGGFASLPPYRHPSW